LRRQRGENGGLAFSTASNLSFYLMIPALVWFALIVFLADDFAWGTVQIALYSIVSVAAFFFLLEGVLEGIKRLTSQSKSVVTVTPLYVIDNRYNDLRYWSFDEIGSVEGVNRYQNGKYTGTDLTFALGKKAKTVRIRDLDTAERSIEIIDGFRKSFIEALARNDEEYIAQNDDFESFRFNNSYAVKSERRDDSVGRLGIAALSIVFAGLAMFGLTALNNYFDDKKNWNRAAVGNSAAAFRNYLQTHPEGRWRTAAMGALDRLYDEAGQKYLSSISKNRDEKAADAIVQVLNFAKITQNFHVKVVFNRQGEIAPTIVEDMKKKFHVKRMLPIGDSFSNERMTPRERKLFQVVDEAFKQVIPNDIIEISNGCVGDCVQFLIDYRIDFTNSVYWDLRQEKVAEDGVVYYPGIGIDWDFKVQIPNRPETYEFSLDSKPANEISYDSNADESTAENKDFAEVLDADKSLIYDSMVASAFDDFKVHLLAKTGMGPDVVDEKPAAETLGKKNHVKSRK